jgi:hypothetical protein
MIRDHIPLLHALIEAFLFLESSGSTEVDPDSAVRCMENMSSRLLKLDASDQIALRAYFQKISDESHDVAYKEFVRKLPDMIDLAS